MKIKLLIIDDDEAQQEVLKALFFRPLEYQVRMEESGERGLESAFAWKPDLILLDLKLPGLPGIEVVRILKQDERTRHIPIFVLSALADEKEIVRALNLGAVSYMVKPFSGAELLARVQAIVRHAQNLSPHPSLDGLLALDKSGRRVLVKGKSVPLTPREYGVLELLLTSPDKCYSRIEILERVWGGKHKATAKNVDLVLYQLRHKLGTPLSKALVSISGVGYTFRPDSLT